MNNLQKYSNRFFDELEIFEDVSRGHSYKSYLRQAVLEFLGNETKETAFSVYDSFFDCYRITLAGETNPFIDLLDVLHSYEENAATLIDKQRDHYIHSVNVFILGLSIYIQNANFRIAFETTNMDKTEYPFSYNTKHEEFFYRWGIAALFHDVGYPIEIIGKQLNKFIDFATDIDKDMEVKSHLEFDNFEDLNSIAEIIPKREFTETYFNKYDNCVNVDLLKPIDLLAHKLHISIGVNLNDIKAALDGYLNLMANKGFIDHGFFSAIIVLKWYGYLIQNCKYKSEYYFFPVLDSASAILLHNYYKNFILKPPFNKGPLSPNDHPIAYLLILCDELQEWNREAYGLMDKDHPSAKEAAIVVTEKRLDVTLLTWKGIISEQFIAEKEDALKNLLEMSMVFNGGFSVGCQSISELASLAKENDRNAGIKPRPLLDNLEKLAIAIHELYNQKQLERHPNEALQYPQFSELPDTLKYSNLRQARGISDKLELMGWEMRAKEESGKFIREIPNNIVETLAVLEHNEWVRERIDSGWKYGKDKNAEMKLSPYLVAYDELPEEIKDQDRDAIRNIPVLLEMIGMAVFKKKIGE